MDPDYAKLQTKFNNFIDIKENEQNEKRDQILEQIYNTDPDSVEKIIVQPNNIMGINSGKYMFIKYNKPELFGFSCRQDIENICKFMIDNKKVDFCLYNGNYQDGYSFQMYIRCVGE
jgi:hypothetical protein